MILTVLCGVVSAGLISFHTFAKDNEANKSQTADQTNAQITAKPEESQQAKAIPEDSQVISPAPVTGLHPTIALRVKLYQIQAGDTLSGIAEKFQIKTSTIISANPNLKGVLQIGEKITILPEDGIILPFKQEEDLAKIAKRYNLNIDQLKTDNLLNPEQNMPTAIFCYNCESSERLRTASNETELVTSSSKSNPSGKKTVLEHIAGSTEFPKGYCTYYVAKKMLITFKGDAKDWLKNAKEDGYVTGNAPMAGSAVVMKGISPEGHVAFVEQVKGDTIVISEMNYEGFGQISQREVDIDSSSIRGYIYPLK